MPAVNLQLVTSSHFMHTDNSPALAIVAPQPTSALAERLVPSPAVSEPSPSFFDWQSESDCASPSPAYSQSAPEQPSSPLLTWSVAAAEARDGIHYTLERWPSQGSVCMSPLFNREPIAVEAGQRIRILADMNDYAIRVRILDTGNTGLIPSWNVEGALERLARLNMAFNEAVTCPAESDTLETNSGLRARLAHVHAQCIPFSARVQGSSDDESDDEMDDSDDAHTHSGPDSPPCASSLPAVYDAGSPMMGEGLTLAEAKKSVMFADSERKVIFRYPSQKLLERREDVRSEDDQWLRGWEEPVGEESEAEEETSDDESDEVVLEDEMAFRRARLLAGTVEEITLINIYDNYE
ncbi:hypothetical protein OBBRIDRAFT_833126 [Obba rivulosa]|uniref:Uncharacterized protein n=1 Tax=Obba rivulosa TaxID=1052685 RepID=A0A8E2DMI9_9APHY|nr:hypothetical protein OBBRIDRAFT_833126 [Obba rivulosa]